MENGYVICGNVIWWTNKKGGKYSLRNPTGMPNLQAKRFVMCRIVVFEYD
ncbi:MAG: hypothetical protein KGD60_03735 [Candidatus Thorarchaeota archaeon]|nr:hypothetical protein [Candidatus Thorarchaeota archaeon]